MINRSPEYRLLDFKITSRHSVGKNDTCKEFAIQMFALNEKGESASITVHGFNPFFFVKVGEDWDTNTLKQFKKEIFKRLSYSELERNYKSWQMGKRKMLIPPPTHDETKRQYADRNATTYQSYYERGLYHSQL